MLVDKNGKPIVGQKWYSATQEQVNTALQERIDDGTVFDKMTGAFVQETISGYELIGDGSNSWTKGYFNWDGSETAHSSAIKSFVPVKALKESMIYPKNMFGAEVYGGIYLPYYDSDKKFLSSFALENTDTQIITPPDGAAYLGMRSEVIGIITTDEGWQKIADWFKVFDSEITQKTVLYPNVTEKSLKMSGIMDENNVVESIKIPSSNVVYNEAILVFSEEFDNPQLDENVWSYEVSYKKGAALRNNTSEYSTDREENCFIKDSCLYIHAKRETVGEWIGDWLPWSSASIVTKNKFEVKNGLIEIRCRFPSESGFWPAFWMLGAQNEVDWYGKFENDQNNKWYDLAEAWPSCGEIDWVEKMPYSNDVAFNLHCESEEGSGVNAPRGAVALGVEDISEFHTYTFKWTDDAMEIFVDGVLSVFADLTSESRFDVFRKRPFYFLLGNGVRDAEVDASIESADFVVDYIRVYALNDEQYLNHPTRIELSKTKLEMAVDDAELLKYTIHPTNKEVYEQTVKWESSDDSIATVHSGYVWKRSQGECTITATMKNGVKAICTVADA